MQERDASKNWTVAAVLGGALVIAFLAGAAWYLSAVDIGEATGDLASATIASKEEGPYKPTSRWVEEGVDLETTTFGFGGTKSDGRTAEEQLASPGLTEPELQNIIYRKQNTLMSCYADALRENPDLQGRVDMRFAIAPDGHLAAVEVTGSELRSPETEDCLVDAARHWSFPGTGRSSLMKFETDFRFVYE